MFGLCIGVCVALVVTAAMFLPRKLMTLSGYMDGVAEGVRSMVGAIMILVLAWSLGGTCRYLLGTGEFVSGFPEQHRRGAGSAAGGHLRGGGVHRFAMGTSWGTIALILPIVIGVFPAQDPLFLVAIGATLGGAVYGDMCRLFRIPPFCRRRARSATTCATWPRSCRTLRWWRPCVWWLHHRRLHGQPVDRARRRRVLMIAAVLVLNRSKYGAVKA